MTPNQKARLDRIRDERHFAWAKKHARALTYPPTDDALKKVGKKCWDDSWNAAVEHLLPVLEACEWYAKGGSFQIKTIKLEQIDDLSRVPVMALEQATQEARSAIAKVFGEGGVLARP